jgi:hypothetical protein
MLAPSNNEHVIAIPITQILMINLSLSELWEEI